MSDLDTMVKEPKNIDFYTTGKQPSEADFAKISELIKKNKEVAKRRKRTVAKHKKTA